MQASSFTVVDRLFSPIQLVLKIPVYQRNYDWAENNTKRLLQDIKTVIETGKKHFIGAIVYMESNDNDIGMQNYLIIDGQQRLTTLTLFLKALYDLCTDSDIQTQSTKQTIKSFLINQTIDQDYKIKLKPIKSDNIQYQALLTGDFDKLDGTSHIIKNYLVAKKYFQNWISSGINPTEILLALRKLEVVGIVLEKGQDDPQIIFESINSTGVALTNSDLIRNFLLMSDENQDQLFEQYWLPLENRLRIDNDNRTLDTFFRQFLVMKYNSPVKERKVYESYINMFNSGNYSHEDALKELNKYSKYYYSFLNPDSADYNKTIKVDLVALKQINQTTCYPFLMHVFNDYDQGIIDEDILTKVIDLITVYLIRRAICEVPTNSLNGLFAYLYARVFRVKKNLHKYYESINKYLFAQNSKDAIPNDGDLTYALNHFNLYQNYDLCKLLLLTVENNNKEKIEPANLSVEHIMPQTLSKAWKTYISDEEHDTYVNTLGNLSLTGYNSEMSNKSFSEKKKILSESSRIKILNEDVIDKDRWTIDDIKARGQRLANILIDKFKLKPINDISIEFELVDKLSVTDPYSATGRKPVSFTLEGSNYREKTFKKIVIDVAQLLDQDKPEVLESIVGLNSSNKVTDNATDELIRKTSDKDHLQNCNQIRDDYYIYTSMSAGNAMKIIGVLLQRYGVDNSEFSVSVKKKQAS